jgi:hypothetical protein
VTGTHVLGIVVSVTGTIIAADQVRDLDRGLRSRGWRSAPGRILGATTLRGVARVILAGLLIWVGLHTFYGGA